MKGGEFMKLKKKDHVNSFSKYAKKHKTCRCSCPCGDIPVISYVLRYQVNGKSLTTISYGINH